MNRTFLSLVMVLVLLLSVILSACGQETELAEDVEPEVPVDEPADESIEVIEDDPATGNGHPASPYSFPLTGIGTDTQMLQRPIVVMVENQAKARPQDGLYKADIVYEVLAEGDITRFVAVFQSQSADIIGPVRSLRPYFAQIGHGLDGLIVHAGWSQEAINYIYKYKLAHFDEVYGDGAYYWRDKSRKAPHNLYTKTELIREGAVKKKFREEWTPTKASFYDLAAGQPVIAGNSAEKVDIHYIQGYYVGYEYDAALNRYNRTMLGEPHVDKTSGIPITAENVMVVFTKHKIVDKVGRRHIDVTGPGSGYLIQQGQIREISWENKDGMIRPYIDGQEAQLLPGQTWVQIVPEGSKVEYR